MNIGTKKNRRVLAVPTEDKTKQSNDMFSKVKNFIKGPNKVSPNTSKKEGTGNKANRVSALANRRRK